MELGAVDGDLGDGLIAGVGGGEIFLFGIVEGLLGDYAVFGHLEGALVGVFVHGKVGGFGVDLVVLDGGGGGVGVGLGGGKLGALGVDLGQDLDLVELGEDLALFDGVIDVGVEAGDDTGGFGLDFDLGDGLDFAGGDYGTGDVTALGFGKLGGLNFGVVSAGGYRDAEDTMTTRATRLDQIQIFRLLLRWSPRCSSPGVLVEGRYGLGLYYAGVG